jgi:hypothetical protein
MKRLKILACTGFLSVMLSTAQGQTPNLPNFNYFNGNNGTTQATGSSTPRTLATRAADTFNVRDYGASGTNSTATIGYSTYTTFALFAAAFPWATIPQYGLQFTYTVSSTVSSASSPANQIIPLYTSYATNISPFTANSTTNSYNINTAYPSNYALTPVGPSSSIVPEWADPNWFITPVGAASAASQPNNVIMPGMLVTGSCIASGTTVSYVGVDQSISSSIGSVTAPAYGTISLSQAISSSCAQGTALTFTMPISQIQAATTDWLGFQSATYAADTASNGSSVGNGSRDVYIPSGIYNINLPIRHYGPSSATGNSQYDLNSINYRGSGTSTTFVNAITDLGLVGSIKTSDNSCLFKGPLVGAQGLTNHMIYTDLTITGASQSVAYGLFPSYTDGICLGEGDRVYHVNANNFHAGFSISGDHIHLSDIQAGANGCGIRIPDFQIVNGNVNIDESLLIGNTISGFCVAATSDFDSNVMTQSQIGFEPFAFEYEGMNNSIRTYPGDSFNTDGTRANSSSSFSFISNSTFENLYIENIGNAAFYGPKQTGAASNAGGTGAIYGNIFSGGGAWFVGSPYPVQSPNVPTYIPSLVINAPFFIWSFSNNTFFKTNIGSIYGAASAGSVHTAIQYFTNNNTVTAAIFHTSNGYGGNKFIEDTYIATGASYNFIPFIDDSSNYFQSSNSFENVASGSGIFKFTFSALSSAGFPVSEYQHSFIQPYVSGAGYLGVSAAAAPANGSVGVITKGTNILVQKAIPGEPFAFQYAQSIAPTVGGFYGVMGPRGAAGVNVFCSNGTNNTGCYNNIPDGTTLQADLDANLDRGDPGCAVIAAAGTTLATATAIQTPCVIISSGTGGVELGLGSVGVPTVSGAGIFDANPIAGIVPIGSSVTVMNKSGSTISVYPPGALTGLASSTVNGNAAGTADSLPTGTTRVYYRTGSTTWNS